MPRENFNSRLRFSPISNLKSSEMSSAPTPSFQSDTSGILKFPKIIEQLGNIGSESDLRKLRQLGKDYYDLIGPTYLAATEKKTIWIHKKRYACPLDCQCSECRQKIQGIIAIVDNDGEKEQEITNQNWSAKNSHLFDKLVLCDIWSQKMEIYTEDRIRILTFISQIAPYISTLSLNKLPIVSDLEEPGDQLIKFLKQFKNLEDLNITYYGHAQVGHKLVLPTISLAELGELLQSLDENKTKIVLKVMDNHMDVLEAFKNSMTNLSYILCLGTSNPNVILQIFFLTAFIHDARLNNIKYNLTFDDIRSIRQLDSISSICIPNRNLIEQLSLEIDLTSFQKNEQEAVKQNLIQLSPLITTIYIAEANRAEKWNLFNEAPYDWSNLDTLSICTFVEHLKILKNCPKLKTLHLIFNGPKPCQMFEGEVEEYFVELSELKKVCYFNPSGLPCTDPGSNEELESFLMGLLPPNTIFENMLKVKKQND